MLKFLDTTAKKRLIFSFIIYLPIMSVVTGTPLPFPSLFEPSQAQIGLLNGINLSISVIGAIIGGTFYLERRQNLKLETQNKEIVKVEEKIDEGVISTNEHIKAVRIEMKEMEQRICNHNDGKYRTLENKIEDKVVAAKTLEDERINNLSDRIRRLERINNG